MCNLPLVSICIPTYNGQAYIEEALNCIMEQTYGNLEVVISDDDSKDDTLKLAEDFKNKVKLSVKIYNHEPQGIGANWNNCIKHASGKYIKFLFQDDVLLPTCIEEMVRVMEEDDSIGLVASKRDFIIEDDFLTKQTEHWIKKYKDLQYGLDLEKKNNYSIINRALFKSDKFLKLPSNKIGEPSVVLFRKKIVDIIGYFREDLKQILDYEFYYRLLKKYKMAVLNKKLVKFRLHNQQATNVNNSNDILDYKLYDDIIYKEYFWYINNENKFKLLKKYNPIFKFLLNIKKQLKL